jgi:FKBP-type peptidyl-prolyl cis-trans isomerase SlpA
LAATREKTASFGIAWCAQGPSLGLQVQHDTEGHPFFARFASTPSAPTLPGAAGFKGKPRSTSPVGLFSLSNLQACRGHAAVNLVQPGSFITLHYRLAGPDGASMVNTFGDKPATLSLGTGQLAPALEQRLLGLHEGAHETFELPAGEAFGSRNPELLQRVKLALLHELGDPDATYGVGDVVQFPTPDGQGQYAGVVREAHADWLLFDFNHPLAGESVKFEVQLLGVL